MKAALLAVMLLALSGCNLLKSSKGGYSGPPELEQPSKDAINAAIVGFRDLHGLDLKWKWSEWRIRVKAEPVVEYRNGLPMIAYNGTTVGGYYDSRTGVVHVPERGLRRDTLVHEMGHALLWQNGYKDISNGPNGHHARFAAFFRRYRYGGGHAL